MSNSSSEVTIKAILDDNPGYRGSVHEDSVAKAQGYKAALIPGAFVYDYVTRLGLNLWGADWMSRGAITVRFRRPVYDGDTLTITATPTDEGAVDVAVANEEGEHVVVGTMAAAHGRPAPTLADMKFVSAPATKAALSVSDLVPGLRFSTNERVIDDDTLKVSRMAMGNALPVFVDNRIAHPGCMVRLTMFDVLSSYKFPLAPVFTSVDTQNFAVLKAGSMVSTSAQITKVFERNGKIFFESEEFLVADRSVVIARHLRTNLVASA
ncbi:hypothetical protein [Roseinatronobacter sp.]